MQSLSGSLHAHTDGSNIITLDAKQTVKEYVKTGKELGATHLAITDHGSLVNHLQFYKECKENNIKAIIGVELYVAENEFDTRKHLVLLAKDYIGYKSICKIVSKSFENMWGKRKKFPCVTKDLLEKNLAKGHVVGLSGCVQGVLASILLQNKQIDNLVNKIEKRKDFDYGEYDNLQSKFLAQENLVKGLKEKRDLLTGYAKLTYIADFKKAQKTNDEKLKSLAMEKQKKKEFATNELPNVRNSLKEQSKILTEIKKEFRKLQTKKEKIEVLEKEQEALLQQKRSESELFDLARKEYRWYKKTFKNLFFVELQYHGLEDEKYAFRLLEKLGNEENAFFVATNDAHYSKKEDALGRQILKSLEFKKYMPLEEADKELYVKSDAELYLWLTKILSEETVTKAMENISKISNFCDLELEKESHAPRFIKNKEIIDAEKFLWEECLKGKENLIKKGVWNEEYEKRLNYEFGVIKKMGYCDYLCIVQDYVKKGDELAKKNPEGVGLGVGFGRGSGAGSLVCYLTGITKIVNPIKENLLFERFLNPERVSMPDIDTDFAMYLRNDVIDYVKDTYGQNAVCSIMTRGTHAGKSSIADARRFVAYREMEKISDKEKKKEIEKSYIQLSDKLSKKIVDEDNWYDELYKDATKTEKEILDLAKINEGVMFQVGVHPAGVIISDNEDVSDRVPLMFDKNGIWKTQSDMVECEENHGLLKMDFLGLKTLDIITNTFRAVKRNKNILLDIENIPFDKEVLKNIYQKGLTNGVFQFESEGMKQLLKEFQPESIADLVLLNAVYRPGPLQYIPEILAVKRGEKSPKYLLPQMKDILSNTYGYPVYQEQIMQLFQLAGFSLGKADIVRRYMSKKKTEKFMAFKDSFVKGFCEKGAKKQDVLELWEQLLDFSKYAFNKSHSCVYAYLSYDTAYLKWHYPAEYIASYLTVKSDAIMGFVAEKEPLKIKFEVPNINLCEKYYEAKGNSVVIGLSGIKGIGQVEDKEIIEKIFSERKKIRFSSLKDFIFRTNAGKGILEPLIYAGAFDELHSSREALINHYPEIIKICQNISKYREKGVEDKLKEWEEKFKNYRINGFDTRNDLLLLEKEMLGTFISQNPLENYEETKSHLANNEGKVEVLGYISNIKVIKTKTNKNMAFFEVADLTANMEGVVFPKIFENLKNELVEGVFVLKGQIKEEYDSFNEVYKKKFHLEKIIPAKKKKKRILVKCPDGDYKSLHLENYVDKDGYDLIICDEEREKLLLYKKKISEKIFKSNICATFV